MDLVLRKGDTVPLEVLAIDSDGNSKTGLTVNYTVYKSSDNSVIDSGTLTEVGTSGIYKKVISLGLGQFRVVYDSTGYTNDVDNIIINKQILGVAATAGVWNEEEKKKLLEEIKEVKSNIKELLKPENLKQLEDSINNKLLRISLYVDRILLKVDKMKEDDSSGQLKEMLGGLKDIINQVKNESELQSRLLIAQADMKTLGDFMDKGDEK